MLFRSKRQLLPELRNYWPGPPATYIEPFAGSACLYFDIEPARAVLGDLNRDLITAFRAIRNEPAAVVRQLSVLETGRKAYLRIRSVDPRTLSAVEAAARFLYLNHYCFNGLYRTNKSGKFNVPFGRNKSKEGVDLDRVRKASRQLKSVKLIHGDFEKTLKHAERHDFVYLDPPYSVARRRIFGEYTPTSFGASDLPRLKKALNRLDRKGVMFVLTYAYSQQSRKYFSKWTTKRLRTKRNIAGFCSSRRGAYEILVTNCTLSPRKHD